MASIWYVVSQFCELLAYLIHIFIHIPVYIAGNLVNVLNIVNVQTYFIYVCYIAIFLLADQSKMESKGLTAVERAQLKVLSFFYILTTVVG